MISQRIVARLSIYRRLLNELKMQKVDLIYSHQLAGLAGVTAAQLRRDLMEVGYSGKPRHGYAVNALLKSIGKFLDAPQGQQAALLGIGNLGHAVLAYFSGRRPKLSIAAAFDNNPKKVNRKLHGCQCYPIEKICEIVSKKNISIAIITVPAKHAQEVADVAIQAGVTGILNFAPVTLMVRQGIYVDDMDITVSLEKVAFFARKPARK